MIYKSYFYDFINAIKRRRQGTEERGKPSSLGRTN